MSAYISYSAACTCGRVMGPTVKSALAEAVAHHKTICEEWGTK